MESFLDGEACKIDLEKREVSKKYCIMAAFITFSFKQFHQAHKFNFINYVSSFRVIVMLVSIIGNGSALSRTTLDFNFVMST